jgi:hypothetical protein
MSRITLLKWGAAMAALMIATGSCGAVEEWKSGIEWPEPQMVDPGPAQPPAPAPSDAVILFDSGDMDAWTGVKDWKFEDDYAVVGSNVKTKQKFGDCQLHLEFATPAEVSGEGQGRGNSGVYLMDRYELQILDSYENKTYFDGQCGAIYKQRPPLVNASRKPGEWQTYDVFFRAPRFNEDGTLKSPAAITALHNGVLIHNDFELQGGTFYDRPPSYSKHALREPIQLQFHGNPVRFRNIWIRDLMPAQEQ